MRRTMIGMAVVAMALGAHATARAGVLEVSENEYGQPHLDYGEAVPGERNALVVHADGEGNVTLGDGTAVFRLVVVDPAFEDACRVTGQTARCSGIVSLFADLGGNDDTSLVEGFVHPTVHGGAGDDVLRLAGDTNVAQLWGDAGDDVLVGGPSYDWLHGGPGADRMSGGGHRDTVDYADTAVETRPLVRDPYGWTARVLSARTTGVTVTLDGVADDGAPGEGDLVASDVETVFGTPMADSLKGTAGTQTFYGRDGADTLEGGADRDVLVGEAGDDRILAVDGVADGITCGTGADRANVDAVDALPDPVATPWLADEACETVTVG